MALKFGRVDSSETTFEEQDFHKGQTLTSASEGVHHYFGLKDHYLPGTTDAGGGLLSVSGSHWAFVHTMFYMSGSTKVSQSYPADVAKFDSIYHNFNQYNDLKPFHTNKFYDSASVFYIPQAYFGQRIQPKSFQLTGRTGSMTNKTKEIIIKDDGNGNLYGYNAHHSQSSDSFNYSIPLAHLTSSKNYIGNIYYDLGMVVLTETASWSGSVRYTDIGHNWSDQGVSNDRDYRHWNLKFNSTTPIFTYQFSVKIPAGEFNTTMNSTAKPYGEAEFLPSGSSIQDVANIRTELTTGSWSPYFTQIQFS